MALILSQNGASLQGSAVSDTMTQDARCKKKVSPCPAMIAKVLLLLLLFPSGPILVDKVAATVNGEVVTLHDIERAIALFPVQQRDKESEESFYLRVLDDLIAYKVIALEYGNEFNLGEEDYAVVQTQILQRSGSLEKLLATLGNFAMSWSELTEFIREKVLYEKVLHEKSPMALALPFSAIEEFYNREYFPFQLRFGLKPRSLAEMTPQIETYLRTLRMETRRAAWLADIRSAYTIEIMLRRPQ